MIKVALGIALLLVVLHKVDLLHSLKIIKHANIYYLLFVGVLVNLDRLFMAYKWGILLRAKGVKNQLGPLVKGYYFTSVVGPVVPSTVGEDVVRGYYVSNPGTSSKDVISSIIIERVLALLGLMFLSSLSLGLFIYLRNASLLNVFYIITGVFSVGITLFLLSISNLTSHIMRKVSLTRTFPSVARRLEKIYTSYSEYKAQKRILGVYFLLSTVGHCVAIVNTYLIAQSLSVTVSFTSLCYTIPTVLLISRLPVTIGGLGVTEGAYVGLLIFVGVSATDSFSISLVARGIGILSVLPVFVILFYVPKWCKKAVCLKS